MASQYLIQPGGLTLQSVKMIMKSDNGIMLSPESRERINKCREFLVNTLENSDESYYGINTGFGDLCHIKIDKSQVEELQHNLVVSHACGMGDPIPMEIARLMLLLKTQNFAYGYSGVREELVDTLIAFFNSGLAPVIYEQGSLGASGDLAPLAHMSLPMIGLGEVWVGDKKTNGAKALADSGIEPISLRAKEGLALLNGTQFMSAYGITILNRMADLLPLLDMVAGLSLDAFDCMPTPFDSLIHNLRSHTGQQEIASRMRQILAGSELFARKKSQVQDPYSFRCIPQVHGATLDVLRYAEGVFENEISSVTDNPNIFFEEGKILSGGNFHGQPLALTLDFMAMAIAELGSIAERRIYKLVSGQRGLPPFLVASSGLHSGFMIPQYTAAGIVSQNKQLCTPASVDTIDSSNGQEDHVSMGANAATKCYRVLKNFEKILAIELMTAAQALEFRRPAKTSHVLEQLHKDYRAVVSFAEKDRPFYIDLQATNQFIDTFIQKN